MQKVAEDVGDNDDFNSEAWFSATNYVIATGGTVTGCLGDINNFLKKEKLEQVVAIVKSCSSNVLGDLNVIMKDLSGTIPGTVHHKVIGDGGYGKYITVRAAMILANVSVFTPKQSEHYLNITKRSVVTVFRMVKELGYENPQMKFYYKKPTADLDKGLEPLSKDIDVLDMLSYVNKYKLMEVFIEHHVDNFVMDTIDLKQEDASAGLGDENVGNVSNDLRDENVEEFDPLFSYPHMQTDNNKGSDHNEGSDNNERSDHNEGSDNNEGSDHNEESDNNEGVTIMRGLNQHWQRHSLLLNIERACTCRKWDLTGMPCKHAVGAIWNMAENGLEPGIPESWVHPRYWLVTWEEMYRFKINPCNGPDLWPPSNSPITYTPPEYHKPAGRPSKKRKKSAVELFDGLVKNGKLSRFGQTVTYCKCGKKVELVRFKEGLHLHQQSTKLGQLKLLSTLLHQQSTHLKQLKLLLTLHLRQVQL
nr:hypothetical protein [Tanacetum cinerariifolium]